MLNSVRWLDLFHTKNITTLLRTNSTDTDLRAGERNEIRKIETPNPAHSSVIVPKFFPQ